MQRYKDGKPILDDPYRPKGERVPRDKCRVCGVEGNSFLNPAWMCDSCGKKQYEAEQAFESIMVNTKKWREEHPKLVLLTQCPRCEYRWEYRPRRTSRMFSTCPSCRLNINIKINTGVCDRITGKLVSPAEVDV